jgi:hypothetical protein
MSVKFRIGLTIDGETLFGIIAKMLPVEDVSVEEVSSTLAQRAIAIADRPRLKQKQKQKRQGKVRLKAGINGIILTAMADGPKRALELKPLVEAAGYSQNSVNSRLEELRKKGITERVGDGKWRVRRMPHEST